MRSSGGPPIRGIETLLMGTLWLVTLLTVVGAGGAEAQNLVTNGGFDQDFAGWTPGLGAMDSSVALDWREEDALSSSLSGSLEVTKSGLGEEAGGAAQCIPVTDGEEFVVGGRIYLPSGQAARVNAGIILSWAEGDDCTFVIQEPVQRGVFVEDEQDRWVAVELRRSRPDQARSALVLLSAFLPGGAGSATARFDDVFLQQGTCAETATQLCLSDGRFRVRTRWETQQGTSGDGRAVPLTDDTGYFWFFDRDNVELVLKVLNACSFANRFWVFAGGLTNVGVEIQVDDTAAIAMSGYANPVGTPFEPIQDTDAFMTCP
jgi:hypothetical protein